MKYDLVIKNGYIYDENKIIKNDIAINDGIIVKIGNNIDDYIDYIDASNCVILPGFINTHIHFGEYYIKGYDGKLTTKEYIKYAENFNDFNLGNKELIRKTSSKICAYEAIKFGQTTLMGIRGWNSIEEYNIRLYMGYPLMKSNKLKEYLDNPYERFEAFKSDSLNNYYIFIHSLLTVNEYILSKLSEYIKDKKVFIAIHLRETKDEEKEIKKKFKLSSLEVLEKYGLLSDKTLLVHCCYINDNDIKIIKKYKCSISICPCSNLKLNNRILNILKYNDINICVGTDGVASNDSLNIMDDLKILGLLYNISSYDLIKMITINPNKYLNNKIGKICENYKADFNIYDLNNYKVVRKETFINNLIYSSDIIPKHVIVDGKYIVRDYKNIKYSENDISNYNISDKINFDNK